MFALSPEPIFDDAITLDYYKSNITLPLAEQLYTARGLQSVAGPSHVVKELIPGFEEDETKTLLVRNKDFGA